MPAVGVDSEGDIVIAWTTYGQDNANNGNPGLLDYGIYDRIYYSATSGKGLAGTNTGEFRVNATTPGDQVAPAVAFDNFENDALIAWVGPDPAAAGSTAIFDRSIDPPNTAAVAMIPATPSISVADATVSDGTSAAQVTFTVTLSASTANPVTVNYSTADGTAKAGVNYTAASGTLVFAAGQTSNTITVNVDSMDMAGLPTQTFLLNLTSPSNATLARASATGTIIDSLAVPAATVSVADISVPVGATGGQAVFTVSLSAPTAKLITVGYSTADGTAKSANGTYRPTSGTLMFAPGQMSQTVSVPIAAMTAGGLGNQTFQLNLTGSSVSRASATATIVDVAPVAGALPSIYVSDSTVPAAGTATYALFSVNLSAPSTSTITVAYGTADGTATVASGAYTPTSGTLTFTPGQTSQVVAVPVAALPVSRLADRTFIFNVASPTNATIARASATATIVDSVPVAVVPTISVGDVTIASTATQAVFTVSLSGPTTNTVSMVYGVGGGTAPSTAYSPIYGSLTFQPGQTTQTISVPVTATKTSALNNETFNFAVANAVNGTFARSLATATFVIPAAAPYVPTISVGDVTIASTATQAVFTVSLSGPTTNTVSMIYGVGGGTAPSTAYSLVYGSLTFQPGQTTQTISVPVTASKTSALNNETFNFAVANAVNGTFARSLATATFVIPASAPYVPAISVGDVTIASTATQAVFTVSLSGPTTNTVSMIYGVGGGTAPSTAYSPIYGTLTFQPGQTTQTISVPVTASKSSALNNETFNFAVANAVNGTFARSLATATFVVPASAPYVPTISVGDVTIASTATQAVFTVSLSGPTTNTVTMIYGVGGGTAPSTAYSPIYGTLTFQPGQTTQTVSVPILASRTAALNNETFLFAVANAVNGTIVQSQGTATFAPISAGVAATPALATSSSSQTTNTTAQTASTAAAIAITTTTPTTATTVAPAASSAVPVQASKVGVPPVMNLTNLTHSASTTSSSSSGLTALQPAAVDAVVRLL